MQNETGVQQMLTESEDYNITVCQRSKNVGDDKFEKFGGDTILLQATFSLHIAKKS